VKKNGLQKEETQDLKKRGDLERGGGGGGASAVKKNPKTGRDQRQSRGK